MAGVARDRIEHAAAIDQIAARQDIGGVGGPVHKPPGAIVRAPGRLGHFHAMRVQPLVHQLFGQFGALRPVGHRRQIAQPGETVDIILEIRRQLFALFVQLAERHLQAAKLEAALTQRLAARRIAGQWIVRHGKQARRQLAGQAHIMQRCAPGQLVEQFGHLFGKRRCRAGIPHHERAAVLCRRLALGHAHWPFRPAILAAY